MKPRARMLKHCSIINSLFTMPFYNNESGIIFLNFIFLLVFLVKLSIIHFLCYLFTNFFNMIMYQYIILPDVLLNYRLFL
ncbi:hypothetical protein CQA10_26220 [Escherichia coli]|nr:hypothetical protein CQA10_26220 [Escherichia coli]